MSNLDTFVTDFEQALLKFHDDIIAYAATQPDAEEAGRHFLQLENVRTQFKIVCDSMMQAVMNAMGEQTEMVIDGKVLTKSEKASRKTWEHDRLRDVVLRRLKQEAMTDDGELLLTPDEAIDRLLQVAHIDYWRVKELNEFGINADQFSTLVPGEETLYAKKVK